MAPHPHAMIPVNIITGVLGVGKTTAIRHLLSQRPAHETWAVVVNEFGALGIDGAVLDTAAGFADAGVVGTSTTGGGDGMVVVREVAGGCLCCAVAAPFTVAVTQVLRRAKPDRLLIEPSGMGHPGGLFDALSSEFLRGVLELKATIVLVDVTLSNSESRKEELFVSEPFNDQVNCADVVVGTKADLANDGDVQKFTKWTETLYPPKAAVEVIENGKLELKMLDVPCGVVCAPVEGFESAHRKNAQIAAEQAGSSTQENLAPPSVGNPTAALGGTDEFKTCGLVFHREELFLRSRLIQLFHVLNTHPQVVRSKGVLRVGKEWVAPRFNGETVELEPVAYRRDSRIEIIVKVGGTEGIGQIFGEETKNESPSDDSIDDIIALAGNAAGALDWVGLEQSVKAALKPPRVS
ncbi:CobW family GTP-binding protein [bacterium]|nr:CobW family GTP-binding protein [bacterium]